MATELSDEDRAVLETVRERFHQAHDEQQRYVPRWNYMHALYHGFKEYLRVHRDDSRPKDYDKGLDVARDTWGADLHTGFTFAAVETILPRMLAHSPRMLYLPPSAEKEEHVEPLKALHHRQQEQIDYELVLQSVAKSGLMYGIGVQKTYWLNESHLQRALVQHPVDGARWIEGEVEVTFDDPDAECVDIVDFLWDPFAANIEQAEFAIHRTWRSPRYVADKLATHWKHVELEPEDLQGGSATGRYDETRDPRRTAQGYGASAGTRKGELHEVWEYHTQDDLVIVLDREWPVYVGRNPAWHGELPFQVYTPTEVLHEMVGKGVIEPIADLQEEMDTLRGQRRDLARLRINQPFAFDENMIERKNMVWRPDTGIPVNGNPREAIIPLQVGDVPNSGYQEEERLLADIERVLGLSEQVAGGQAGPVTATGAQLAQAAATERIRLATRRLELTVIKGAARQWLSLNQQKITENREIQIPYLPKPGEADKRWAWIEVGPEHLSGEWSVEPEGGATAPENVPEKMQKAQMLMQLFGPSPLIDQQRLTEYVLDLFSVRQASSFMKPPEQTVPAAVLPLIEKALIDLGHPPEKAQQMLSAAVQIATEQQDPQGGAGAPPPQQGPPSDQQGPPPPDVPPPS